MIVFKQISKDGSNYSYSFSAVGMEGVLIINSDSFVAKIIDITGQYANDEKEINNLLFIASKKLQSEKLPERCIYATH